MSDSKNNENPERELAERFSELVIGGKLYLNPRLDLYNVAKLMNTNRSYLSKAVNKAFGKSFSLFVNELRVKTSIEAMRAESTRFTIDEIADGAGFANRNTFYRVFERVTGQSLADFRKELKTT